MHSLFERAGRGGVAALVVAAALTATPVASASPAPSAQASVVAARSPEKRAEIRGLRQQVVDLAIGRMGSAYVRGAAGPDEFDCSGLVMWVYQQLGFSLPHFSGAQMDVAVPVTGKLRRGDLLFYGPDGSQHVSIYIGKGMQVGANNPRTGIVVDSVEGSYWSERYVGAGRLIR